MPGSKTIHPVKLTLFGLLSLADLFLTRHLVHAGEGRVYESNPLASAWLESYGWTGLAVFKALAMLLVVVVALYVSLHRPRVGGRVLGFACLVTGGVVAYSCYLSGWFGEHASASQAVEARQAERHSVHLDREITCERRYALLLDRVVKDVVAGRCGLAEGVERLAQSEKGRDPRWHQLLKKNYPRFTGDECLALHLGYHALVQTHRHPERFHELALRLERDFEASYGSPIHFEVTFEPSGMAGNLADIRQAPLIRPVPAGEGVGLGVQ